MLKLKRYLKPYLALLLAAVALLFGQAMLELTLPNYMSDIVNIGLQQGGITDAAPEAIGAEEMAMMETFMSESDKAAVQSAYTRLEEGSESLTSLRGTYPGLEAGDWALAEDADRDAANAAFSRAAYALVDVMGALGGGELPEESSSSVDMEAVASMMAALGEPAGQQALAAAVQEAAVTPESMLSQTGVVFTRIFYQQLGRIPTPSRPAISGRWASRWWGSRCCSPPAPSRRASAWPGWAPAWGGTSGGIFSARSPISTTPRWTSFPPPASSPAPPTTSHRFRTS